jgi:hypothetical protein
MGLWPDHVFGSNKSMHKELQLGRQCLKLKGIVEVLNLIMMTQFKGYEICTARVIILGSFLLD